MPTAAQILAMIRRNEAYLRRPDVHQPVAKLLALYCQSDPKYFPEYIDAAWLPASLEKLGRGWGRVTPQGAFFEMGGGFYHYGYRIERDVKKSRQGQNVWKLSLYREEQKDIPLSTLPLPTSTRLSETALVQQVAGGYDRQVKALLSAPKQDNEQVEDAYQSLGQDKLRFLLRLNRISDARQASERMLVQRPNNWWVQLLGAVLRASQGLPQQAEKTLTEWVQRNRNFFSYLDLAYYYQLQNEPKKASRAMLEATRYNADVSWGHDGNAEFRGYSAAMYAVKQGEYDTAIKLCNYLLKVNINSGYARPALRSLRAIAFQRKAGKKVAITWSSGMLPFTPFEKIDLNKLLYKPLKRQ
jgi:tetratricopeptide (TPR) repeat protein